MIEIKVRDLVGQGIDPSLWMLAVTALGDLVVGRIVGTVCQHGRRHVLVKVDSEGLAKLSEFLREHDPEEDDPPWAAKPGWSPDEEGDDVPWHDPDGWRK